MAAAAESAARRLLAAADGALNRLYGWRLNPIYQSGSVVVLLLVVTLVTGVYLLVFYRIGAPYESVARITEQAWTGRWMRSLHRYASDALVVFALLHAFRMFAQGRSWGPRALAWISGWVLLLLILVVGWTGYVMVWDAQAQLMAVELARLLDPLPLFSEPLGRAFVGEQPIPRAFFFLNLFLHILLPIGLAVVLWVHVSRVGRARVLPDSRLGAWLVGLLLALSVLWPVGMAPAADLFRIPESVPLDLFYAFWLPLTLKTPTWAVWLGACAVAVTLVAVPWLVGPFRGERPGASRVDERLCTGCEQCVLDCPYEAVSMVPRADGRATLVARVDPTLCVSCGICAGSCAPMGVGPPGRTGRDQLAAMHGFLAERMPHAGEVVVVGCERSLGGAALRLSSGLIGYPVSCAGAVHTSGLEAALRRGAGGVAVVTCPPRDCWNREGATWVEARLYREREAELQARVDRRRVRLIVAGAGREGEVAAELLAFLASIRELAGVPSGAGDEDWPCRRPGAAVREA